MHCLRCNKTFSVNKYCPNQKYCSKKCADAYGREHHTSSRYGSKHDSDTITENNSEYLRIIKAQHNPNYKFISKNYLNLANRNRVISDEIYGFYATKIRI